MLVQVRDVRLGRGPAAASGGKAAGQPKKPVRYSLGMVGFAAQAVGRPNQPPVAAALLG